MIADWEQVVMANRNQLVWAQCWVHFARAYSDPLPAESALS
jgi:hypothetical protein